MSEEPLRLTTTAELLKAVELGIVDKTEARAMLGLGIKRGRFAKIQLREGGRFKKDDKILPFNRFSGTAKAAMVIAQQLADDAGRKSVQTDDMLLALAISIGWPELGIDEATVRDSIQEVQLAESSVEGIGPTAELKGAVERAFNSVQYPGQIGPDMVLLGLATGPGRAAEALRAMGLNEKEIRLIGL